MADNSSTLIKVGAVAAAAYVAYTQGWLSMFGIGAASPPATAATTGTPAATAGANPPAASVPGVEVTYEYAPKDGSAKQAVLHPLSAIQAATILAANAPAEGLGVDAWGYYLNQVINPLGAKAPDPMPLFSSIIGSDRSVLVPTAQYWAIMGPALKPLGFSGLGMYWRTN